MWDRFAALLTTIMTAFKFRRVLRRVFKVYPVGPTVRGYPVKPGTIGMLVSVPGDTGMVTLSLAPGTMVATAAFAMAVVTIGTDAAMDSWQGLASLGSFVASFLLVLLGIIIVGGANLQAYLRLHRRGVQTIPHFAWACAMAHGFAICLFVLGITLFFLIPAAPATS